MNAMKWKYAFFMILLVFLVVNCSQYREVVKEDYNRIRSTHPTEVSSFHAPVKMEIAWVPYEEHRLVKTKKNEWKMVKDDDIRVASRMPMILITYPDATDSLWLDMNTDSEMLGKLVKHSMMTQVPISRPFAEYFEVAKCGTCHPSHINTGIEESE